MDYEAVEVDGGFSILVPRGSTPEQKEEAVARYRAACRLDQELAIAAWVQAVIDKKVESYSLEEILAELDLDDPRD